MKRLCADDSFVTKDHTNRPPKFMQTNRIELSNIELIAGDFEDTNEYVRNPPRLLPVHKTVVTSANPQHPIRH